jgi:E3 ubiquitin-protein ligase RNF144
VRKVAKDKKWQRCPKCNMYVERVDGCVYMVCSHSFCFSSVQLYLCTENNSS